MFKIHRRDQVSGLGNIVTVHRNVPGITDQDIGQIFVTDVGGDDLIIVPDIVVFLDVA